MSLEDARECARLELDRLPAHVRHIDPAQPPYRVDISPALEADLEKLQRIQRRSGL